VRAAAVLTAAAEPFLARAVRIVTTWQLLIANLMNRQVDELRALTATAAPPAAAATAEGSAHAAE